MNVSGFKTETVPLLSTIAIICYSGSCSCNCCSCKIWHRANIESTSERGTETNLGKLLNSNIL